MSYKQIGHFRDCIVEASFVKILILIIPNTIYYIRFLSFLRNSKSAYQGRKKWERNEDQIRFDASIRDFYKHQ